MPIISQTQTYRVAIPATAADRALGRPAFRVQVGDIVSLPFSGLGFKLAYAGSSTVDVSAPGIELLGEIGSGNDITVYYGTLLPDGRWLEEIKILRADLTGVDYSIDPRSAGINLSGSRAIPYAKAGAITARHIARESGSGGERTIVCQYDPALKPGARLILPGGEIRVASISHTALGDGMMTVAELTAVQETARGTAEASTPQLYPGLLITSDAAAGSVEG